MDDDTNQLAITDEEGIPDLAFLLADKSITTIDSQTRQQFHHPEPTSETTLQ